MKQSQTPSLTREELYKLVWSKPLSTIEKEFNKLPIEIKNACEKFNKQQPIPELQPLEDNELKNIQNILELKEVEISPIKRLIKQQIEEEKQKVNQLFIHTENWVKANNLRNYIQALEQNALLTNSLNQETKEYISWANKQADLIAPLIEKNQ